MEIIVMPAISNAGQRLPPFRMGPFEACSQGGEMSMCGSPVPGGATNLPESARSSLQLPVPLNLSVSHTLVFEQSLLQLRKTGRAERPRLTFSKFRKHLEHG